MDRMEMEKEEIGMNNCRFTATRRISEVFDAHDVKYRVIDKEDSEAVLAGFTVENGPNLLVYFISTGDRCDTAVRIYNILNNISPLRQFRILKACNELNCRTRYLKYCLASDNTVQAEMDFPKTEHEDEAGEQALMLFITIMHLMDGHYRFLAKALYTDEPLDWADEDNEDESSGTHQEHAGRLDMKYLS